MKASRLIIASATASVALLLAGCGPQGVNSISSNQSGQVVPVQYGEITAIRPVEIRPGQTNVGTVAGGALGAIGGSQIGSSTAANIAGGVAGAVAGGALGSALQGSGRTAGLEITIRLDSSDQSVAIVQPGDPRDFRVGDRVRITGTAENARVTR